MQKHWIFTFIVSFFYNLSYSQNTFIKGIIKDKKTSQRIEDVFIHIHPIDNDTHTDRNGVFYFANIPAGKYELEIEKAEYEKQIQKIEIATTDTLLLEIAMGSTALVLSEVSIAADKPVSAASSSYLSQSSFLNRPQNSAQDLLHIVPGLFIAQHAGGGKAEQIFIRGLDCDYGTDIATFVDGILVN